MGQMQRNTAGALERLTAAFGNRLITSQTVREQHANMTTWLPVEPPDAVVYPQSTQDVQTVVRICAQFRVPVIAFGAGTSLEGHVNAPYGGISVDFKDMNRILAVHADDLDCVVEPGVTRKQLNEEIKSTGLFFPIDPGANASLGGMATLVGTPPNVIFAGIYERTTGVEYGFVEWMRTGVPVVVISIAISILWLTRRVRFSEKVTIPAPGAWSATPFPSSITLYKDGQGWPKDFNQAKADEYFKKVVGKVRTLVQDTIKKWEMAGF